MGQAGPKRESPLRGNYCEVCKVHFRCEMAEVGIARACTPLVCVRVRVCVDGFSMVRRRPLTHPASCVRGMLGRAARGHANP